MNVHEIEGLDGTILAGFEVKYFDVCRSTNDIAMASAVNEVPDTVFIAGLQTAGKGRLGRKWENKKGESLEFSILKATDIKPEKFAQLTPLAGLCVRNAIEKVCGVKCDIKWPNDILIDGKKICGILTEAKSDLKHVVVGIGINVASRSWDEELAAKAASIEDYTSEAVPADALLKEILERFNEKYEQFLAAGSFMPLKAEYESNLINTGKAVTVYSAGETFSGTAIGIDDELRLLVRRDNGNIEAVMQGDVSLTSKF